MTSRFDGLDYHLNNNMWNLPEYRELLKGIPPLPINPDLFLFGAFVFGGLPKIPEFDGEGIGDKGTSN